MSAAVIYPAGDYINYGGTNVLVKRAFAAVAASASNSVVVAAVTGKSILVISLIMNPGATATTCTIQSNTTAISPAFNNAINAFNVLPLNVDGWFKTTSGEGLSVTTGAGSTTNIHVVYAEV